MSKIRYYCEVGGRHNVLKPLLCSYNNLVGFTQKLKNKKVDRAMRKLHNALDNVVYVIGKETSK